MNVVSRGIAAGLAGTALEAGLSAAEESAWGAPVYAPRRIVANLAERWLGRRLSPLAARAAGDGMRLVYGVAWGVLAAALSRPASVYKGSAIGLALMGFELKFLPVLGATPPARTWSRRELLLNALNTLSYGLVTAMVVRRLERPAAARP